MPVPAIAATVAANADALKAVRPHDEVTANLAQGLAFIKAEVPDAMHELMVWNFWTSLAWFVALIIIASVFIWYAYSVLRKHRDPKRGIKESEGIAGVVCAVIALLTAAVIPAATDWLQIWLAPKAYVAQMILNAVK